MHVANFPASYLQLGGTRPPFQASLSPIHRRVSTRGEENRRD